jgi:hypothetical protein
MQITEMPSHNHGGATGGSTTGYMAQNNVHGHSVGAGVPIYNTQHAASGYGMQGGTANSLPRQVLAADAVDINHWHSVPALGISLQGGPDRLGLMQPYEVDNWIVRIK